MAHFIMDDKFYGHRQPAWHNLGHVSQEDLTALEVGQLIKLPRIAAQPLFLHEGEGDGAYALQVPNHRVITAYFQGMYEAQEKPGVGIPQGGMYLAEEGITIFTYGTVSATYQLVTHEQFIDVWHRATGGAPVETMGLLYNGDTLFITTALPKIDIRGDEVQLYLFGYNPVDGRTALRCRTTGVRVVCHNTATLALRGKTEHMFRTSHMGSQNVLEKVERWLTDIWAQRQETAELMQETYELLANFHVTSADVDHVVSTVYSISKTQPEDEYSPEMQAWEQEAKGVLEHRQNVIMLFESSKTITQATHGTGWGVANAVAEWELYGRGRVTALSKVMGTAHETIEKAFATTLELARR